MKQIIFVTGNKYKFEVAQKTLEGTDIKLIQQKIETPEIQSTDVKEIAAFSAKWATEKLKKPVALTDAGYYIEALNGFPGPFIKYINQWLTSEDLLRLMEGKTNRKVIVRVCLAYCEPGGEPVAFPSEVNAMISEKAVKTEKEGSTPINEIYVPEGYDKVETEISREEMVEYWGKLETYWQKLADYLLKK
ncbi:non-canonical purine NTP pyrophosphatase [Candidatus Woesebacteria bacterium]|nr:non-canonical purine NTP pyrophosphatase [Candidatus Woesebacteria bacterium]